MKTQFPYGQRTPEERLRYPRAQPNNRMWACDNPDCQKVHHYAPYCPNEKPTWAGIFRLVKIKLFS